MYTRRQSGQWRLVAVAFVLLLLLAVVLLALPSGDSTPTAGNIQASGSAIPAPPIDTSPTPAPDSPFPSGTRVRTTEGVNLRTGPTLGSPVLGTMTTGSELIVKEGPREADGYRWWRVETTFGTVQQGWMAEGWWERIDAPAPAPAPAP